MQRQYNNMTPPNRSDLDNSNDNRDHNPITHESIRFRPTRCILNNIIPPPATEQLTSQHYGIKIAKSVRFSDRTSVVSVPSLDDYSTEEWEASYLTCEDIKRINNETARTLETMRRGHLPDDDDEYFRGLEPKLPKYRLERNERIDLSTFAVLQTQDLDGAIDPKWIEEVYVKNISSRSARQAYEAACWDAGHIDSSLHSSQI